MSVCALCAIEQHQSTLKPRHPHTAGRLGSPENYFALLESGRRATEAVQAFFRLSLAKKLDKDTCV
jgi:hypothetical protein